MVNNLDHEYIKMFFEFSAANVDFKGLQILCYVFYRPPSSHASKFDFNLPVIFLLWLTSYQFACSPVS